MRVLLINRFWADSRVPSARMLLDVARSLRAQGRDVVVLTSADSYAGAAESLEAGGVAVLRLRAFGPRLLRWALFWAAAAVGALVLRWDRCLILTDPPFMNWLALPDRLLRGRGRRRYWWVMDLYPEALCAAGLTAPGGRLDRALRRLNDRSLAALDGVIVLDGAQRARLARYPGWSGRDGFSIVVPPWDRRPLRRPGAGANRFAEETGLAGRRIILYAGNLGRAHVFEPLLSAARRAAADDWAFVFVCRGHKRAALERQAAGLGNVRVLDYVAPQAAADMLFAADVHVITLEHGWEGVSVPSKLYGVLPTGRPVLYLGPESSGTAEEIARRGAGRVLPASADAAQVVAALEDLLARPPAAFDAGEPDGPERIARFIASS